MTYFLVDNRWRVHWKVCTKHDGGLTFLSTVRAVVYHMVPARSWICLFSNETKYTAYDCVHENDWHGKILTNKEPIRTPGFNSRLPCHIINMYERIQTSIVSIICKTKMTWNFSSSRVGDFLPFSEGCRVIAKDVSIEKDKLVTTNIASRLQTGCSSAG